MALQFGGARAPLLIVPIQMRYGWRASFYVLGVVGVVWRIAWYRWYRDTPAEKANVTQAEIEEIGARSFADNHSMPREKGYLAQKWHINCTYNYCGHKKRLGRCLMKYTSTNNERESDSKGFFSSYSSTKQGNVIKRLLVLVMMTICLVAAGAQSAPTVKAGGGSDLVCSEPYIDPTDGQCYVTCCPADEQIKAPCQRIPCDSLAPRTR